MTDLAIFLQREKDRLQAELEALKEENKVLKLTIEHYKYACSLLKSHKMKKINLKNS